MINVLNPTVGPATGRFMLAPRLSTLSGKVLGVLWNRQPHGDQLLKAVVEELRHKYELKDVVFTDKPYLNIAAPKEVYDKLVASCDAVITGIGD